MDVTVVVAVEERSRAWRRVKELNYCILDVGDSQKQVKVDDREGVWLPSYFPYNATEHFSQVLSVALNEW